MEKDAKHHVYEVYNKIAGWFAENRYAGLMEKGWLDDLLERIPAHGTVLDVGCGTGRPVLEYLLSRNMEVTGVDASEAILEIARSNFPLTSLILQDMRALKLNKKFDALIAWHSLFHLPPNDQSGMFGIFEEHLNPNGILLFTSGTEHGETWTVNGGERLYMASLDTREYETLLSKHNFSVLKYVENDPNCGQANVWVAELLPGVC